MPTRPPASGPRAIQRVCVFCGSSAGHDAAYRAAAAEMGGAIAARGWGLVYGGGRVGLMGVLADAVLAAGGDVTGIIPEMLATRELLHTDVTRLHRVPSMHARKAQMEASSDAFFALPGGYGTFEELLEIITWAQLGIHAKPVGLLNVRGFFDKLIEFVEHAITEGFIRAEQRRLFVAESSPEALLDAVEQHKMPSVRKWIEPPES